MTQTTPTKEQINKRCADLREAAAVLDSGVTKILGNEFFTSTADLIEALAAQLAEAQSELNEYHGRYALLKDELGITDGKVVKAVIALKAAAASSRRTGIAALTDARETIKTWHGPVAWDIYERCSPEMKRLSAAIESLKSTPAPVTPSTTKEGSASEPDMVRAMLIEARKAIASLDPLALGNAGGEDGEWPIRDEILENIDRALTRASAPAEADESGWLIERRASNGTPLWLTLAPHPSRGWTAIASEALRFARREDADNYASLYGNEDEVWYITEHSWPSFRPLPSPPTAREGDR